MAKYTSETTEKLAAYGPALALGGVQAAVGYSAARRVNGAINRAHAQEIVASLAKQRQVQDAGTLERQKRLSEAELVRGRLRVLQASAGVGAGGSFAALQRQTGVDSRLTQTIIRRNTQNQLDLLRSGLQANLEHLSQQAVSPLLAAFAGPHGDGRSGAVAGVYSGLTISKGIDELFKGSGSE